MLRRLAEYLDTVDPGKAVFAGLGDIETVQVDGFETWLKARYITTVEVPWRVQNAFVRLLRNVDAAVTPLPHLAERLKFTQSDHARGDPQPIDALEHATVASLRRTSLVAARALVARIYLGERMARGGTSPVEGGWNDSRNVIWHLRNVGMIDEGRLSELRRWTGRRGKRIEKVFDLAYARPFELVAFSILLCHETALPPECIHDLQADCLADMEPPNGWTKLRYVKNRQNRARRARPLPVEVNRRFSVGWLVKSVLRITAAARRNLGLGPREGPLFLARRGVSIRQPGQWSATREVFLRRNAVVVGDDVLSKLDLRQLRKWRVAGNHEVAGGRDRATDIDHSLDVRFKHYLRIASLRPMYEGVVAEGLTAAYDAAMGTPVPRTGPNGAEGADMWVSGCLDFHSSPYAKPGAPCGAPVWGCLDCRNAVFPPSKVPGLLRLLNHVVAQRDRLGRTAWRENLGVAYVRLRQILDDYPPELVEAAMLEVGDDRGAVWSEAQLTGRID